MNPAFRLFTQPAASALCIGLVAAGCNKSDAPSSTATAPGVSTASSLSQELGVAVPTQEEADARAALEINAENADQAFEDLEKEAAAEP